MSDTPNLEKWAVTDTQVIEPAPRTKPSKNVLNLVPSNSSIYKHDSTYLNKELTKQIALIHKDSSICTKAQLMKKFEYSTYQFSSWLSRVSGTYLTDELWKKRDELLEANLLDEGFRQKMPTFVIFLLKNNHGYRDVKDIDNNQSITFNVTRGAISSVPKRKQVKNNN